MKAASRGPGLAGILGYTKTLCLQRFLARSLHLNFLMPNAGLALRNDTSSKWWPG